jgi:hypothetical protein
MSDVVALIDQREGPAKKRGPYKKRASKSLSAKLRKRVKWMRLLRAIG